MAMLKVSLPASLNYLEEFISALSAWLVEQHMKPDRIKRVQLAVEEALVNVFRYAYGRERGTVELHGRRERDGRFVIEIRDEGVPFDGCSVPAPDLSCSIKERRIGGLGIFLIRKMADEVRYRREGNQNILTLVVDVPEEHGRSPLQDVVVGA
ncbi:MAG: ATP-binding protein [Syntrophales bacterium]|nr:ATP-binding protein [Syntrophales bacterium]